MKNQYLILVIYLSIVFSCQDKKSTTESISEIIKAYETKRSYDFKTNESVENTIKYYQKEADFSKNLLEKLTKLTTSSLSETEQISAELLRFVLQDKIDQHLYKTYLNPITSEYAFHLNLGNMGNTTFKNIDDIKKYLKQLDELPKKIEYQIALLKKGVELGISQPKAVFDNYDYTYNKHIVSNLVESEFYKPFLKLPNAIDKQQKDSILTLANTSIQKNVIEQYQKIKTYFEKDYFINTRTELGVTSTQNGKNFYQNRINFYTTSTQYNADSIHQIGLKEVARIKNEMLQIINELNFKGSFAEFLNFLRTDAQFYPKTAKELLMFARDIAKRIDAELPKFFKTLPRKPYGVVPVPDYLAPKYTGGRYSGSRDEKKAGFYWVNTYNLPSRTLYTIPALTAHEAVPGHHLQIALNDELSTSIPLFRRNLYLSAYGEGWGLYAETLADEMGIYTTPYEKFGKLTYEMWRACRLVVDTGIHAKGWSRAQVINYLKENTALSIHEITTETDRYISWPAQALSYKIGELKIKELRKKAEQSLKNNFDIREFHQIILAEGTVTLAILEKRILQYIQHKKND